MATKPNTSVSSKFQKLDIPPAAPFGKGGAEATEFVKNLMECPVEHSFLEEVTVADTITDPKERLAAFREEQNKVANRANGAIRRYKAKAGNEGTEFAVRKVNDDAQGRGVRIWKVKAA